MDRHTWKDMTADGGGALVGIYILESEDGLEPRLRYQYTDGQSFPSDPAQAKWMPEMLRLAEQGERLLTAVEDLCIRLEHRSALDHGNTLAIEKYRQMVAQRKEG